MKWIQPIIDSVILVIAYIIAYKFVKYDNKKIAAECNPKEYGRIRRCDNDQRIE